MVLGDNEGDELVGEEGEVRSILREVGVTITGCAEQHNVLGQKVRRSLEGERRARGGSSSWRSWEEYTLAGVP